MHGQHSANKKAREQSFVTKSSISLHLCTVQVAEVHTRRYCTVRSVQSVLHLAMVACIIDQAGGLSGVCLCEHTATSSNSTVFVCTVQSPVGFFRKFVIAPRGVMLVDGDPY